MDKEKAGRDGLTRGIALIIISICVFPPHLLSHCLHPQRADTRLQESTVQSSVGRFLSLFAEQVFRCLHSTGAEENSKGQRNGWGESTGRMGGGKESTSL